MIAIEKTIRLPIQRVIIGLVINFFEISRVFVQYHDRIEIAAPVWGHCRSDSMRNLPAVHFAIKIE
jgi:hypothetical protein